MRRKKILCFTSYYLPGFKSGGPLRSLLHMQEWLGTEFDFGIVTRNRDLGEHVPYPDVEARTWRTVRGVSVWYLAAPQWLPGPILQAIRGFGPDALYFHSSVDFSLTVVPLMLRRLGLIPRRLPVLVAPRGEYSPGARAIKEGRKKAFFRGARLLGLYGGVTWHATKDEEAEQIRALWGTGASVVVAPNLPSKSSAGALPARPAKQPGMLRLVFLSRISRMKNLHGALAMLRDVAAPVKLDIYGPREDPAYWAECEALLGSLPPNIEARYRGGLAPDEVIPTLATYDAFLLPSLGENFGHVIHEALLAGCPVILSDRTPWLHLAECHVGFDIPLDRPEAFRSAIERLAAMDDREHRSWCDSARAYGARYSGDAALAERTRTMLAMATA
jgi:glycosyltransferase involved in cell wall biosynthesis